MRPNILIATPSHRGDVAVEFMSSVLALVGELHRSGMSGGFVHKVGTGIDQQRNWLATNFWADTRYTHILFIDDDMIFNPSAIMKLVRSGYDVCGCIYPQRNFDLEQYHSARLRIEELAKARNVAQSYVSFKDIGKEEVDGKLVIARRNSFVPISAIGFGITMVSRRAIGLMLRTIPAIETLNTSYFDNIRNRKDIIRFFDNTDNEAGIRLSEDLSFCHRWTHDCRGMIWACVDETIGHIGKFIFHGRASDQIEDHAGQPS